MWRQRLTEISSKRRLACTLWLATAALLCGRHLFVHGTGLGDVEMVLDEAGTWGVANRPLATLLTLPTEFHSQPPLYYFLLRLATILNDSVLFMRGLSWFFCLLTLLFVLFFCHELSLIARVFFVLMFLHADLTHEMATTVRPYAMSVFLTLVATVMLVRLFRQPSRWAMGLYIGFAVAMAYTMAFEVAVLLAHGLFVAGVVVVDAFKPPPRREGLSRSWASRLRQGFMGHRQLVAAIMVVAIAYLPYVAMAVHYQYAENTGASFAALWRLDTYRVTVLEHFGLPEPIMFIYLGLWLLAAAGGVRTPDAAVVLWTIVGILQIAFVYYFIVGRSMVLGKYMAPTFLALCMLGAIGGQRLLPRADVPAWGTLVAVLVLSAAAPFDAFGAYLRAPRQVVQFERLRNELVKSPGRKIVFFDVGFLGQHLEYEIRNDPQITTATMRGRGWGSAGDNHLTPAYVTKTIETNAATTECFYYFLESAAGPYTTAFVPTLNRLGFKKVPRLPDTHGRQVPGFCK
jgi:hypothetical protein